jgi:hypothetical protein
MFNRCFLWPGISIPHYKVDVIPNRLRPQDVVRHFLGFMPRALILAIMACVCASAVACRQPTHREQLIERSRQRLLARMEQDRVTRARFEKLGSGTPSAEVVKELGKPNARNPCNAAECWFYDISGETYFVCFDARATVTCEGKASLFRRSPQPAPPK